MHKKTDPERPDTLSGTQVYLRLLGYVRPHWRMALGAVLAMVAAAATEPAFAALIKPMIDGSFVGRDPWLAKAVPIAIVIVFVLRGLTSFASSYALSWISRNVVMRIRSDLFARMLRLPTRFYDNNATGMLLSKIIYNVEQVSRAGTNAVTTLIKDSLTVLGLIAYMAYLSGWLVLIFLVVGPVISFMVMWVSRRFRKLSRRIQHSMGEVASIAEEGLEGHQVIKLFDAQDYEQQRFDTANQYNARQLLKFEATKSGNSPVVQLLAAIALAAVVYLATLPNVIENITPGTFISFIAAMLLLMPPLKRLTEVMSPIQQGIAAGESLFEIIDAPIEVDTGERTLARAQGRIEFRDVYFNYPNKSDVLKGIDLHVEPGETVALVGRSGSGKTTLVSLLPRLYDVARGEILLDGHSLHDYRLPDLRRQIAMVGQHVVLFNDTIGANIAYGHGEYDRDAVLAAAKAAHALEFIERLPQGLDTPIGENGVMLSGGQRQRLAIARALLKDAPILILDEATSALDSESEQQIKAALDVLMQSRTTLVIAHRLSTIENADRIVVMHEGRIVEVGRHDDLLAQDGHYAALHRIQFKDTQQSPVQA
jgi:subfamily B ATP-binding cassette protein MsbA